MTRIVPGRQIVRHSVLQLVTVEIFSEVGSNRLRSNVENVRFAPNLLPIRSTLLKLQAVTQSGATLWRSLYTAEYIRAARYGHIHTFFSLLPSIYILLWHVLLFQWKDDPDMMHDAEAASPRWKSNPKNFGPNIKSIKFLGSVGFPETTIFLGPRQWDSDMWTDVKALGSVSVGFSLHSFVAY